MARRSIACVLKRSDDYDFDYVSKLREGIERHAKGVDFLCLVGSEWPGWWCKMELFRPEIKGDLVYFDLDTIIAGSLDDLLSIDSLAMLSDFNVPERVASGVMIIPEEDRSAVWDEWIKDPDGNRKRWHGDGDFLGHVWKPARLQTLLPGQFVSYKNSVRGKGLPAGARVVCYHGRPRPRDTGWMLS
jgi:hypothetical protein